MSAPLAVPSVSNSLGEQQKPFSNRKGSRGRLVLALITSLIAFAVVSLSQSANAAIVCENGFQEVSFNFASSTPIVGDGTHEGDKILFTNVATRKCGGVDTVIDALVTTSVLSGSSIVHYEVNTASAGPDTSADTTTNFFEVDLSAERAGGYADFTFAFYKHGTYPAAPDVVTLQNVKATAIDIDNKHYATMYALDSFTLANDTRLTTDYGGGGFPATVTFSAASSNGTNDVRDRVTASYSSLQTFTYRVGVADKDSNGQTMYFGLSFSDLGWGVSDPVTTGSSYTLSYDANGGSGTPPTSVTAVVGSSLTIATNSGPGALTRSGYSFTGWNTQADGLGMSYTPGASIFMPGSNLTLYAIWTQVTHTLSYDLNGAAGTPPTNQTINDGATATVTTTTPTRTGYSFSNWNTQANGLGTSYAPGATTSAITSDITLYATWTLDEVTTTSSTTSSTTSTTSTTLAPPTTAAPTGGAALQWWTVSFDPNGGDSGSVPPSASVWDTGLYNVPGNEGSLARSTGGSFIGWNSKADGTGVLYSSGSKISVTSNVVLYATWTPIATTTTVAEPSLQVIFPTNPVPEDLFVNFPDQLPKTGADITTEVIAALVIGVATLIFALQNQLRALYVMLRRSKTARR